MSDRETVECSDHGIQDTTIVCEHLRVGRDAGFHQGYDRKDPDAWFPDAWCDRCEDVRAKEGRWNDRAVAVADFRLLCSACYLKVRLLNWPHSTHADLAQLVEQSVPYAQSQQDVLRSKYRVNDHERYDWDQGTGQLIFSNRGVPAVVADIQFVGSVSTRSNTWLWSWANKSFVESVRQKTRQVRRYGEEHSLMKLACAYWSAEEVDGWEMAAVSAFLLKAKGIYRSPDDDHGFTFMVMTDVRWVQ